MTLLANFASLKEAFASVGRTPEAAARLLDSFGFRGAFLKHEVDLGTMGAGRIERYRLTTQQVPRVARGFMPHAFGSSAKGTYQVAIASRYASQVHICAAIDSEPQKPWILLHTDSISVKERQDLAATFRRDRRCVLILDAAMVAFAARRGGDPMETLMTCAAPFGWVQSFYTTPRTVPREMFFGRREEILKIISRTRDGCLMYGGRQLGKSALLTQVARECHEPANGRLAVDIDIGELGSGAEAPVRIWSRIAQKLRPHIADMPDHLEVTPHGVTACISTWLQANPDGSILVMFDEADNFLRTEFPGFLQLRRLKDLMETSEYRFKCIFVGLHNVRRLARAPNSPLVHLGEPICIGPMNATAENRAALYRLVVQPMLAAGFTYSTPQMPHDILARVNHYPSLVQVFGAAVAMEAQATTSKSGFVGPRWKLERSMLFEGAVAKKINQQIRERFQWTLDLDPRYDVIAKALALHRMQSEDGALVVLKNGLKPEEIEKLVIKEWPRRLAWPNTEEFRELILEMRDLGVLGDKEEGRFGLRSAQVSQLLGDEAEIMDQLMALAEREPAADYDAGQFHQLADEKDTDSLSPFTDRDLEHLFGAGTDLARPHVRFAVASVGLWGEDLAERMTRLALTWEFEEGRRMAAACIEGDRIALAKRIEETPEEPSVLVVQMPFRADDFDTIAQRCQARDSAVRIVWLISPDEASAAEATGAKLRRAQPIGDMMLRHWLRWNDLAKLDEPEVRSAILAAAGGVGLRLAALRAELKRVTKSNRPLVPLIEKWGEDKKLRLGSLIPEALAAVLLESLPWLDPLQGDKTEDILSLMPEHAGSLPLLIDHGLFETHLNGNLCQTPLLQLAAKGGL